jgi:hypothetical protein
MAKTLKNAARELIRIVRDTADAIVKGIDLTAGDAETLCGCADSLDKAIDSEDTTKAPQ